MSALKKLLGLDIGGTKCSVVLGTLENEDILSIYRKTTFLTKECKEFDNPLVAVFKHIDALLAANDWKAEELSGIGISCGGPLDAERGVILSPPNLIGWHNIPIVDILEKRYKAKTKIRNDADACALAEWKFGAGKGCRNLVFLTFGTGMGAGIILDGRPYHGTNGMAGEIGHVRLSEHGPVGYGKSGSFEGFCSGTGIAQLGRIKVIEKLQMGEKVSFCDSMDKLDTLDAKVIADAATQGDELAKKIYEICGHYLGRGLSILIDALNPEIIIIGGIFSRCRDLLWDEACKVIEKEALRLSREACRIVASGLGEKIGDYAALTVASYD